MGCAAGDLPVLSSGNLDFPAAKARGERRKDLLGKQGGPWKTRKAAHLQLVQGPGRCWACEARCRSTDCANARSPGEVAVGGRVYILHRVWVSVHLHVHSLDTFASAVLRFTAPRGGFAEQPGQGQLKGNPGPVGAVAGVEVLVAACTTAEVTCKGWIWAQPMYAELSLSSSPKIIGETISEQNVQVFVHAWARACTGRCRLPRSEVVAVHGIMSPETQVSPGRTRVQHCLPNLPSRGQPSCAPAFGPTHYSPNHFTKCFGIGFFSTPISPSSTLNPPPRTGWSSAVPGCRSGHCTALTPGPEQPRPQQLWRAHVLRPLTKPQFNPQPQEQVSGLVAA